MTESNEEVLRRSLDAVDRHRTRLLIAVGVAALLLLVPFEQGAHAIREGSTNLLIHATMLILALWSTVLALVIVIQNTVMTKRILRAIELAARK